ncbi:MAG: hypothetical protein WD011_00295 [Nitriliruptoraceae bacterium]
MADPTADWPRVDLSRQQRTRDRWRHRRRRGAAPSAAIPVDTPPRVARSRIAPVVSANTRRARRRRALGATAIVVAVAAVLAAILLWLPTGLAWFVRTTLLPLAG